MPVMNVADSLWTGHAGIPDSAETVQDDIKLLQCKHGLQLDGAIVLSVTPKLCTVSSGCCELISVSVASLFAAVCDDVLGACTVRILRFPCPLMLAWPSHSAFEQVVVALCVWVLRSRAHYCTHVCSSVSTHVCVFTRVPGGLNHKLHQ